MAAETEAGVPLEVIADMDDITVPQALHEQSMFVNACAFGLS